MGGFSYGMNLPGLNLTPQMLQNIQAGAAMVNSPLQSLMNQLQAGQYVYGDAGAAFRGGQITQDQLNQFTEAFNQYTGTTPGNRPFSAGDVVAAPAQAAAATPTPPPATGMAAATNFSPSSGPITDEARVAQAEADAQNRQFLRESGVNVEGLTPEQYQAATQALGEWRNLPENRAYRNSSSAFGRFVDSIGGPAGLFGLTVGALTGGLGYAGMLGSAGAGAAAGAVTGAVSGDPLRAGLAGAAGGILGSGANALLGGPTQGAAAAGTTTPAASATGSAAAGAGGTVTPGTAASAGAVPSTAGGFFSPTGAGSALAGGTASGGAATGVANVGLVAGGGAAAAGAGAAAAGAGAPLTMGGLIGGTSPAAGSVNIGAGLGAAGAAGAAGAGAGAVGTAAPLTMGGLLGGVSPAAGSINIGAGLGAAGAGLGAAAGGAGMGGFNLGQVLNQAGNFLSSPGGQLLAGLGEVGLGYLGSEDQMDLARDLAEQSRFRPYNIQGPLGAVTVEGQDISISPTEQQRAFQESLFGLGTGALGRAGAPAFQDIFARTPAQLQSLVQDYIGQETALPGQARALEQRLLGLGGTAESLGVRGIQEAFRAPTAADIISRQLTGAGYQALPSSLGMVSPFVGMAPGADMLSARGSISGLLGGAGPGATALGGGALRGALAPSREEGLVSQAAGAGLGFLAEGAGGARDITGVLAGQGGELLRGAAAEQPSFNQLAAERLAALRAQARPAEERTTQAALERLFGQGRLGTTGGARVLGELSRAQEEADIARITSAQDFAQNQQNVALENALRRGELGLSALGGALGGQQFLTGTGTGLLGMGAEVGQFGRSLGADVGLAGLRLGEEGRQADIASILSALGQDVSQRQFGAELSEQQRGLNLEALLAAQGQDIGQRQFGTTFGEQQRISNIDALLQAANLDQTRAARIGTLGTDLFGLGAGMPSSIFEAQRLADEARLTRGAQRIAAAEGLFGFGQGARAGELGMGLDIMAGLRTQYDPLIQLANIASGMGGAQSLAAARGASGMLGSFASPYDYGSGFFGRYAG